MEYIPFILRIITLVTVILWFVIYWRGGRGLVKDLKTDVQSQKPYHDRPLVILIAALSSVMWVTGLFILRERIPWQDTPLTSMLAYPGLILTVVGTLGVSITRAQLGKYWSAAARLQPDHAVVEVGAYRVVRHPLYAFAILQAIGTGLAFPTWWNLVLSLMVTVCFVLKTSGEDRFVLAALTGYKEYASRVPYLLIPGLW